MFDCLPVLLDEPDTYTDDIFRYLRELEEKGIIKCNPIYDKYDNIQNFGINWTPTREDFNKCQDSRLGYYNYRDVVKYLGFDKFKKWMWVPFLFAFLL